MYVMEKNSWKLGVEFSSMKHLNISEHSKLLESIYHMLSVHVFCPFNVVYELKVK